jgi:hypothetical protein
MVITSFVAAFTCGPEVEGEVDPRMCLTPVNPDFSLMFMGLAAFLLGEKTVAFQRNYTCDTLVCVFVCLFVCSSVQALLLFSFEVVFFFLLSIPFHDNSGRFFCSDVV